MKCETKNIENEVPDEVLIDEEIEVPRVMNGSAEDEAVLKEEYLSKSEGNEIERMVKGNKEWVSEILKS